MTTTPDARIAVIGMSGRFPDAWDLDEFWRNLEQGKESLSDFTDSDLVEAGIDPAMFRNPAYVRRGTVLEGSDLFDAGFFGFTPREAEITDPQHRIFLECAWHALEDAGYAGDGPNLRTGVYAGASMNTYVFSNLIQNPEVLKAAGGYQAMLGNDKDFLSTRVSYKLNLKGPSLTIQTACSTSLVAIRTACQALLDHDCDMALAGGVSLLFPQKAGYLHEEGMIFSADGHCRPFDKDASGTRAGQGSAVVVLRRLTDAIRERDSIRAIILGAAVNNDGSSKMGYTAPSVEGQAEAITAAFRQAGVNPDTVSYVEAHGTATRVGDPIEIAALAKAFRSFTDQKRFCAIGSLKSNIGHLDAAAGVAGVVKTVLALEQRKIPASLNFQAANPLIAFETSPFYVNARLSPWNSAGPRRAGVSSFGIGGTNAHVVLEEAPARAESVVRLPAQLLALSAKTPAGVDSLSRRLGQFIETNPHVSLADVCYTLQAGRAAFPYRRAWVCSTREEALACLAPRTPASAKPFREAVGRPVTFLFSGQGSQYPGMARGTYEAEPAFRRWFDICSEGLIDSLGCDLRAELFSSADPEALNQTRLTQAALFAVEYSLARMWMAWGVQPESMIGHSIGEYTAACLAGVFSLEDGLQLVEARGRIMQSMPKGSMLAVPLAQAQLNGMLDGNLSLAAVNAPSLCTVSGPDTAIRKFQARLQARGVECRLLHTSHAFHSEMMDAAIDPFLEVVGRIRLNSPRIPFLSNVTGDWITPAAATDPGYWARQLRQTVLFAEGIRHLSSESRIFLEVGPGQALSTFVQEAFGNPKNNQLFTSLPHAKDTQPDLPFVLKTASRLWESGVAIDWGALHEGEQLHRVSLPGYPFERQRYCVEPRREPVPAVVPTRVAGRRDFDQWFFVPSWTRTVVPSSVMNRFDEGICLIFRDRNGFADAIAASARNRGCRLVTVESGEKFQRHGEAAFAIDRENAGDYKALLADLKTSGILPRSIIFLWGLPGALPGGGRSAFHCMLRLAQALGDAAPAGPLDWVVVSTGVHDVTGREEIDPEQALILGPVKVIPTEYPFITCRGIDLPNPTPTGKELLALADNLVLEPGMPSASGIIAYRDGHRWEQTFIPAPLPASSGASSIRERGVYFITGGTGGIGLTLAAHLAENFRARLVLTCRTSLPPRAEWSRWIQTHEESDRISSIIRAGKKLESAGAEVLLLTADAADAPSMHRAVLEARERFGRIDGVIHAAGIAAGGLIQLKTRDSAEAVLTPKVDGATIIGSLFREDALDFLILCSSINAIAGVAGAVDYCAANLFLDAFAAAQRGGVHGCVTSLNWDAWQEVGMAANTVVPADMAESWKAHLAQGIKPAEGVVAFLRALDAGLPQVAIVTRDLRQILNPEPTRSGSPTGGGGPDRVPVQPVHPGGESNGFVTDSSSDMQRSMTAIWKELLGVDGIGVDDNFFELGGHSLLATRVLSRVRDAYGLSVPLQAVFDAPTIRQLSEYVDTVLWATAAPVAGQSDLREELEF